MNLWIEPSTEGDAYVTCHATLEDPQGRRFPYFIKIPQQWEHAVKDPGDAFLVLALFQAMRYGGKLHVKGCVSPSLIENLEEFQTAWSLWRPGLYKALEIEADEMKESTAPVKEAVLMPFSGGLDSCFSVLIHRERDRQHSNPPCRVAMMVHGFDISIDDSEGFARALVHSRAILDDVGMKCIDVATNVREHHGDWEDTHGAALAACIHLLGKTFGSGVIASSHTYDTLRFPWGSNPLTDPMLSSQASRILSDGYKNKRSTKAEKVAQWPAAIEHLRVCWINKDTSENCGHCLTCVGTALCFAASGAPVPHRLGIESPELAVSRLGRISLSEAGCLRLADTILATAGECGVHEPWVAAIDRLLKKKKRAADFRQALKTPAFGF
ncbi:MAG: hypothetical protein P1U86_22840 [Verrucomicrobiales bacterium]|nr:hypothetical protein [Verrucomicrobiales bacterium]